MALERTLSIIKPDAVARGAVGAILATFEGAGLRPVALKMLQLTESQARGFYAVDLRHGDIHDDYLGP